MLILILKVRLLKHFKIKTLKISQFTIILTLYLLILFNKRLSIYISACKTNSRAKN